MSVSNKNSPSAGAKPRKIKVGTKLHINQSRKGRFDAVATKDFDTAEEFWPVAVDQNEPVVGMANVWNRGDEIPCRGSFVIDWHIREA